MSGSSFTRPRAAVVPAGPRPVSRRAGAVGCGVRARVATLLHNFASYAAALAGYTAAIIAADELGATGGPNADAVFLLAVYRASEICIGIVCAGIVLAGTDFGGARRRLAALFAALSPNDGPVYRHVGPGRAGNAADATCSARARAANDSRSTRLSTRRRRIRSNPLPFAGVAESYGWFVRRTGRLAHGSGAAGAAARRRGPAGGRCRPATHSEGTAIG